MLKRFFALMWNWFLLLGGALIHLISGKTPKRSHIAMVALFCQTQGRTNDLLSSALSKIYPPYDITENTGVLHDLPGEEFDSIQKKLEEDGYYVFKERLSPEFCERILQQSLQVDCFLSGDEVVRERGRDQRAKYDRKNPVASFYILPEDDITDMKEVQELVCDPVLVKVAQRYLNAKPVFSGISMRWSPAVKDTPDSEAAQLYHFDMERIKWLRFFIYITDVDSDSGPHCFIAGTHRAGAIPRHLLEQGYARQTDEVIYNLYGKDREVEFTGVRGTIIAEDSKGYHKGKMPKKGDRLLLAFELSAGTFGANKRHLIRNIRVPQFGEFSKKYPRLYRNFDFDSSQGQVN